MLSAQPQKRTQPPCWLSSGAEDLEIAQQASSQPTFSASSASVMVLHQHSTRPYDREIKGDAEP